MTARRKDPMPKDDEKTSHTPGPWKVADYKTVNSGNHVIRSPDRGIDDPYPVVASVIKRPGYEVNARLIAAAPEMYDAIRLMIEADDAATKCFAGACPNYPADRSEVSRVTDMEIAAIKAMRAAFKKARGR